jgi:transcriptional antiterminator RfaH
VKHWYVAYTKVGAEPLALLNLDQQGFRCYCPYIGTGRARRSRTPLFSRYIFVELDIDNEPWRAVNGTLGVVGLVQFGPKPSPVPDGVVEAIANRETEAGTVELPEPVFHVGDMVMVAQGPLDQQLGIICRLPGPRRAELLLFLMGREVKVTTSLSQVKVA